MKELLTPIGMLMLLALLATFWVFRGFKWSIYLLIIPTIYLILDSSLASLIITSSILIWTYLISDILLGSYSEKVKDWFYWVSLILFISSLTFIQLNNDTYHITAGISLLMFLSFGWISDAYYGRILEREKISYYLTYFLYFPKFISGPVETTANFLPQLKSFTNSLFDKSILNKGISLIILGLFKKFVIADNFISDEEVFGHDLKWNILLVLWFSFIHFVKIYADFSGLIDIVRGVSMLFGLNLKINFNKPFSSVGIKDYWSRWHISLSNWVLENLFKPISFQFRGLFKQYTGVVALFVSFGVITIWHGLSWNYLIFSLLHVAVLIIENIFNLKWITSKNLIKSIFQRIIFLSFLSLMTLFFNNYEFLDTAKLFGYMMNTIELADFSSYSLMICFSIVLLSLLFGVEANYSKYDNKIWFKVLLIILVILAFPENARNFIYEF
jgi:alginate O-acetyltransferase complex protein AlgI